MFKDIINIEFYTINAMLLCFNAVLMCTPLICNNVCKSLVLLLVLNLLIMVQMGQHMWGTY
jgi:hypothetical protein